MFAYIILKYKIMKATTLKFELKIIIVIAVLSVLGCNNDSHNESILADQIYISEDFDALDAEEIVLEKSQLNQPTTLKDLKIIKSANARYKVNNVKDATEKIKTIAIKHDAYISDLRYTNDLYKKENRFTLKVPQKHFDFVMDSISNVVDFIEYENITTKDVTEEYVDLESRLKTKIEVKKRYESILRNNAKTVGDILKTEDKLRILQEEIESVQGRLKYLTSKVAYSTIQIDLYETVDYKEEPKSYKKSFWDKTKEGVVNGWSIIESVFVFLVNIWPLLIIGIFSYLLIKRRFKK